MTELATGYVSIVLETSRVPGQLRGMFSSVDREATASGRNAGRSFSSSFGSSLKGLGAAAGVTGGVVAVAGALKSAISSGMDFTNSLNTMQAVAGASASQVAKVGEVARQLGTDNSLAATSSVDAAQAMLELAKGGFTVDQSMQAARGTLQLAAAAQISAAEAATIQSQALQAFGKDASYAGTASDILANAANQSSAEITDVALALQQGGAVANQFGVSMQDSAATIALLANAGIQGSDAGTLLKSALLALTDQGKPAQAAMQQLGVTAYDAQGKFVGMETLFGQLQAASKRMTPEMYQAATATLFGSDAARLAGVAAQQGATGFDKLRDAMGQQGAAADVAKAKMQGLPGAWERFKNSAQDAGLAFYDAVQGPLASAATWGSDAIEKITDTASQVGPKLKGAFSTVSDMFESAGGMEAVSAWGDRLGDVFTSLMSSAKDLVPVVGSVVEMFGQASAVIGAVGIETFVSALEATSEILSSSVVPVLQLTNSALSGMQPVVVAAIAAWMGFKLISPALGALRTQVTSLTSTTSSAAGSFRNFAAANTRLSQSAEGSRQRLVQLAGMTQTAGNSFRNASGGVVANAEAYRRMQAAASSSVPAMGRFGSAITQIGQSSPTVARMQTSFVNAATSAQRFGRTAGTVSAAATGLRAAGSGVAGVFGGPVGLAMAGAVAVGGLWAASAQRQKAATEEYSSALKSLAEEQKSVRSQLIESRGVATNSVYSSLAKQVDSYSASVDAAAKKDAKWTDVTKSWFSASDWGKNISGDTDNDSVSKMDRAASEAKATKDALDKLGLTSDDLGRKIGGSSGQWEMFRDQLMRSGEGGATAAKSLQGLRDTYLEQQDVARRITPGVSELGDAMQVLGDKSSSAGDKLNALKSAMDAMNPARSKTEAMAQYGEAIRKAAEAAQGIDGTAFDQAGKLNATTQAGATLSRTLTDLVDKSAQVKTSGGDMGAVLKGNEDQFRALATATNQPIEKIRELYAEYGGKTFELLINTQGAPETIQDLAKVKAAFDSQPGKKTVTIESDQVNQQTMDYLRSIGAAVTQVPGGKTVTITTNDQASARLALVTQNLDVLGLKKANPTLDLNTVEFQAKDSATRASLQALQSMKPTPEAGMIIQDLLNGQAVSMSKLDELARTTATPQAQMEITKIMQNIDTVNQALDRVAKERTAYINAQVSGLDFGDRTPDGGVFRGPGIARNAEGSIRSYAAGGINALENYANGGSVTALRDAAVLPGRGRGSLFQTPAGPAIGAEGETVAEAWIPFASSKRGRSTDILATVADVFGYALLPKQSVSSNLSGLLGALAGGSVGRVLATKTGLDGLHKFADGGIRSADEINRFPRENGLEGAAYKWSQVHWGDCSAAQSGIARYAVGLDPWGGRGNTANFATYLPQLGFEIGTGSPGDYRVAWKNGGEGGGHAAGTLPDGTNVEMGGARGNGQVGGQAAGADNPMFTDHAFLKLAPSWKDAGTDPGGFVVTADGAIEYKPGNGNYSAAGAGGASAGGSSAAGPGGTSISTRLGSVVGAFVEGQVKSMLDVLSVNDSPGIVGAISEYENQVRSSQSGSGDAVNNTALKQSYETAKAEADKRYEAEKLKRLQDYQAEQKKLQDQQRATKDAAKRADLEQKLADLRAKHQSDDLAAKQKHDDATLTAKQKYDEVKNTAKSANSATAAQDRAITDPGMAKPAPGQDVGGARARIPGALASTGSQVKDAFRSGLRAAWQQGQPWADTGWIANKESSWNPLARNGKYWGIPQAGPEVYQAAGKAPNTPDPREQGQVFDRYVGERYQDPMKAKAQHVNAGWYERGGTIHEGANILMNGLGHKETALPFDPRDLKRSLDNGGGISNMEVVERLDRLIQLIPALARGQVNYNLRDERGLRLAENAENRRVSTAMAGR